MKDQYPKRYYAFHVQIINKGVRLFGAMKFLTESLETKESISQLNNRAGISGWPIVAYSNKSRAKIIITKLLIESEKTVRDIDYIALEDETTHDFEYISEGIDLTKTKF
jgi:hypothetical protein